MRWTRLLADLESQMDALVSAEIDGEIAERTRIETSAVHLTDRLRAGENHPIQVRCVGVGVVRGTLAEAAEEWLLLVEDGGREVLVPLRSVVTVAGWGRAVASPGGAVRLGLRHALRGIARDRSPVAVHLTDGSVVAGTVDRVGADFVDLAEHPAGEPRRPSAVRRQLAVPITAIAVVRRC
jgi:hypothetical protein